MADQDKHRDVHILFTKCVIWSSAMFERRAFRAFCLFVLPGLLFFFSYMCRVEAVVQLKNCGFTGIVFGVGS